ncbi:MAG TPA: hypothetical protein P5262_02865 [Candidatus Moranbacteria bacterium]|mgnify:CR=1 FL=1|nr:hypothetical protein [Candidatus Moranbacteria bacterium]
MKEENPVVVVFKMFPSNGTGANVIREQVAASFICPEIFFGEREIFLSLKPAVEKQEVGDLIEKASKIKGIGFVYHFSDWSQQDCQAALLRDGFDLLIGA